ncbi:armadillo-type protein, partial [Lobosporangium transversale]
MRAFSLLVHSSNVDLQRSAAIAFSQLTREDFIKVEAKVIKLIVSLLQTNDSQTLKAALDTLINLMTSVENVLSFVQSGGLEWIKRIITMMQETEIVLSAVRCLSHLAITESLSIAVAEAGLVIPLAHLTQSEDDKIKEDVVSMLARLAKTGENKQHLIDGGAIPALIRVLKCHNPDAQSYAIMAIVEMGASPFDVTALNMASSEVLGIFVSLTGSTNVLLKTMGVTAVRKWLEDKHCNIEFVRAGLLQSLCPDLQSTDADVLLRSLTCINMISECLENQPQVLNMKIEGRLIELMEDTENDFAQGLAISTLFRISHNSERGRQVLFDAGIVQRMRPVVLQTIPNNQALLAAIVSTLSDSVNLRQKILPQGAIEIFVCCTTSSFDRAQRYGMDALNKLLMKLSDLKYYVAAWDVPAGGIHGCLTRSLGDTDIAAQKRALMMITALLKGNNGILIKRLKNSTQIKAAISRISTTSGTVP